MKHTSLSLLFILGSALLSGGLSANAGTPAASVTTTPQVSDLEKFFTQDYLLGTWGGVRTDLAKKGVDFEFFYIGSMPTNFDGGIKTGTEYQGALLLALDIDFQKLGGGHGGAFHVSSVWLEGDSFSANHIGDLNKSNLVDFPSSFRLWEIYFQQKFLNDTLTLKVGQMSVDRDFIVPDFYNSIASINFLNQTFFYPTLAFNLYDIPGFPKGSHGLPSTPYGSLGVFLKWAPTSKFYVQGAVYDGNPDTGNTGTKIKLSREEGALAYFEIGYRYNQGKDDTGLPGSLKLGGFYHTDDFLDLYDTLGAAYGFTKGARGPHDGNYGGYFLAEQMLTREHGKNDPTQQGLLGFFRLSAAPSDRNLTQFGVDGGLVYKGVIPSRDYDTIGIAASYLEMSDDLARAQRRANLVVPGSFMPVDYEGVVELNYKAQIAAWWTLQPSLQYVIHPGGSKAIPDAWVFILQTTLRF